LFDRIEFFFTHTIHLTRYSQNTVGIIELLAVDTYTY
jgi:hypothetical protein